MSVTIHVNGQSNSLVHKGSTGIAKSTVPDVCKTPSPGGPVPIPYPIIVSMSSDLKKGTKTVKVDGKNMAAVKGSEFSRCSGDEAGTAGGVKSSTNMKEATWILYSFDVKLDGKNACRLSDKMMMNHGNTACLCGETDTPVSGDSGGEKVKKGLNEKDKNRKPPNGPIDYENSTIAGDDVSDRILDSPPDGDFIWVQLLDSSFRFASRSILTSGRPAGLKPFPHPMLSEGNPVQGAGEGFGKDGKAAYLNRDSGHFQPPDHTLGKASKDMREQGLADEDVSVDSTNPLVRDGANREAMRALLG